MRTVALHDLTKRYGAVAALEGLTAPVQPARITAFLGANGSGKTTTMLWIGARFPKKFAAQVPPTAPEADRQILARPDVRAIYVNTLATVERATPRR